MHLVVSIRNSLLTIGLFLSVARSNESANALPDSIDNS